jgi:hypothetical protein
MKIYIIKKCGGMVVPHVVCAVQNETCAKNLCDKADELVKLVDTFKPLLRNFEDTFWKDKKHTHPNQRALHKAIGNFNDENKRHLLQAAIRQDNEYRHKLHTDAKKEYVATHFIIPTDLKEVSGWHTPFECGYDVSFDYEETELI